MANVVIEKIILSVNNQDSTHTHKHTHRVSIHFITFIYLIHDKSEWMRKQINFFFFWNFYFHSLVTLIEIRVDSQIIIIIYMIQCMRQTQINNNDNNNGSKVGQMCAI